jgi:hypothetical protein
VPLLQERCHCTTLALPYVHTLADHGLQYDSAQHRPLGGGYCICGQRVHTVPVPRGS